MIDDVGPTERQAEQAAQVGKWADGTYQVGSSHQVDAERAGHEAFVMKWAANGNIAIIGHGRQEEAFGGQEHAEEGVLKEATVIGDDFPSCCVAHQHSRNKDWGIAEIQESQVTKEKVLGQMELGTSPDDCDNANIAHHSGEVDWEK